MAKMADDQEPEIVGIVELKNAWLNRSQRPSFLFDPEYGGKYKLTFEGNQGIFRALKKGEKLFNKRLKR